MSPELPTPDERRQAAMEDGSGFSSFVSRNRFSDEEPDEDYPQRSRASRSKRSRPTGKPLEGKSGIEESRRKAAADARELTDADRARTRRGVSLARETLKAAQAGPSPEEQAAALAEELRQRDERVRRSWDL